MKRGGASVEVPFIAAIRCRPARAAQLLKEMNAAAAARTEFLFLHLFFFGLPSGVMVQEPEPFMNLVLALAVTSSQTGNPPFE